MLHAFNYGITILTFQQTCVDLNKLREKADCPYKHHTISPRPPTFTPPLPYKQSINMLFQVMMGKSIWEGFFPPPPPSTEPSLASPATFLRVPPRTRCESGKYFKDCSGCDWMWRLMKLDKHKKCVAQESNGCCLTCICDKFLSPQKKA